MPLSINLFRSFEQGANFSNMELASSFARSQSCFNNKDNLYVISLIFSSGFLSASIAFNISES